MCGRMAGVKTKRFYFIMKTKNVRIASMPEQAQLVPAHVHIMTNAETYTMTNS